MVDLQISEVVKTILEREPKTRDNDQLLIIKVWLVAKPSLREDTFYNFGLAFISDGLPSTESIRRSRQALQNKFPELRGDFWYKRHEKEKKIIEQLSNI